MQRNLFISRVAPTPSGYLHIGNGVNFLITWVIIRSYGGILHLRIDDFDAQRVRKEYIDNIFQTLEFLGIDWDRGAQNPTEYYSNYAFDKRLDFYKEKLALYQKECKLLYACKCSRKEIQKTSRNGLYPKTCLQKKIDFQRDHSSLRLHVKNDTLIVMGEDKAHLDKVFGDFIVWRKDDLPSYQFASLMDDEKMGINLIVRGEDLLLSSMAQKYAAQIFRCNRFLQAKILHHSLLQDEKGDKISKSTHSKPILEEKNLHQIFKKSADLLNLQSGAQDSLQTLQEAFKSKYITDSQKTLPSFKSKA